MLKHIIHRPDDDTVLGWIFVQDMKAPSIVQARAQACDALNLEHVYLTEWDRSTERDQAQAEQIGEIKPKEAITWDSLSDEMKNMLLLAVTKENAPYTTDMNAAWMLTGGFTEFHLEGFTPHSSVCAIYTCKLYRDMVRYAAQATTPQDAICKAFLLSAGVKVE